ncbi:hypothetical protein FOA52_009784 [Chlamydomonas sp. UWO 241]|nr:hypothetical protein FOA52_009784 [Chlamydomonas sp. UWO 241]
MKWIKALTEKLRLREEEPPTAAAGAEKEHANVAAAGAATPPVVTPPVVAPLEAPSDPYPAEAYAEESPPHSPMPPVAPIAAVAVGPPSPHRAVEFVQTKSCPPEMRRTEWALSDFEVKAMVYKSDISAVYRAIDKRSATTVALKVYHRQKLTEIECVQVSREIHVHNCLSHQGIIQLFAAWKDPTYVYLMMEWAEGGDLYAHMRTVGVQREETAVPLMLYPVLLAVQAIHAQGIIHRDIKPENILVTHSMQVKLSDFGLSINCNDELANTRLGTIDYLAPEILDCPIKEHPMENKLNPEVGYTNKVDCWSLGVLAYELLVGEAPFSAGNIADTLQRIRNVDLSFPTHGDGQPVLSAGATNFIMRMLKRNPEERPEVYQLLTDEWLQSVMRRSRMPRGPLARSATAHTSMSGAGHVCVLASTHAGAAGTCPVSAPISGLKVIAHLQQLSVSAKAPAKEPGSGGGDGTSPPSSVYQSAPVAFDLAAAIGRSSKQSSNHNAAHKSRPAAVEVTPEPAPCGTGGSSGHVLLAAAAATAAAAARGSGGSNGPTSAPLPNRAMSTNGGVDGGSGVASAHLQRRDLSWWLYDNGDSGELANLEPLDDLDLSDLPSGFVTPASRSSDGSDGGAAAAGSRSAVVRASSDGGGAR